MALIKDEWLIRKTSSISIAKANKYIRDQLDKKQDDEANLDNGGDYIDNYFADLFDSRDGSLYRIFSVGATNNDKQVDGDADNGDSYYNVVKMDSFATKDEIPDVSGFKIEEEIEQIVDNKIKQIQIDEVIIG